MRGVRIERWPRRQGTALLGMVALAALIVGAGLGGLVAEAIGMSDWIGVLLGAVGGYLLSRWLLHRWFRRENPVDPWPDGGWLVHAAFGMRRYEMQPLPLGEGGLPPEFNALDDDEQERRMQAVLSDVLAWGSRIGCDRVEAELPLPEDEEAAERAGLRQEQPGRFGGPFVESQAAALTSVTCPERIWISRGDDLVIYVHETWDSLVVQASESEIASLRAAVTRRS
jgi:hypothetical protein